MATWDINPSFWYQGTESGVGAKQITIHYGALIDLGAYESVATYEWVIYVYNSNNNLISTEVSEKPSGSVTLTVNEGGHNIIRTGLKASYTLYTPPEDMLGPGKIETKYLIGSSSSYDSIRVNTSSNRILQITNSGYDLNAYTKNSKSTNELWGNIYGLSETLVSSAAYIDGLNGGVFRGKAADWLKQWQIWRSWYDQQNRYTTTTWGGVSLIPSSPISASWYNACSSACEGSYTVSGGYTQDIYAKYFRDISNRVTNFN